MQEINRRRAKCLVAVCLTPAQGASQVRVVRIFNRAAAALSLVLATFLTCQFAVAQSSSEPIETTAPNEARTWWLPEEASTFAGDVDRLFYAVLWMTSIVGIAVMIVLVIFLFKYRYRPDRTATYIAGNERLELVWTLIPALLMAGTAAVSQATWGYIKNRQDWPTPEAAVERIKNKEIVVCEVIARQFNWAFHYPGPDGKLGPRKIELIKQSADLKEVIGLDTEHPDSKDDIVTPEMVVPVNKEVFVYLTSTDVLHSFYLPNFRVKQDAVPGLVGRVWFQATKESIDVVGRDGNNPLGVIDIDSGKTIKVTESKPFDIVCAELCGANHFAMRGMLYVVTQEQFDKYVELYGKLQAPADDDFGF